MEALIECDLLLEDMAKVRDAAILATDGVETQRDEARGQLRLLLPQMRATEHENQALRLQVHDAPSRLVWASVGGAGTVIVLLTLYLLTAQ